MKSMLILGGMLLALMLLSFAFAEIPPGALNVRDFGAMGDGVTDDAPAINRAIAVAIQHGPGAVLFLPAGTYGLGQRTIVGASGPGHRGFLLGIDHADGLTIEGEPGTRVVGHDLTETVFHVEQSRGVTIRRLEIDADPLPFTQGLIKAVDPVARTIDLQVDPAYDDIDRPDLELVSEFRLCDSPSGYGWKEDQFFPQLVNRVKLGPRLWRLSVGSKAYRYDTGLAGKSWMLWAKGYKGWAFHFGRSDQGLVEDVQIHECGSGGFDLYQNGSITVRRCTIGPAPGSNRIFCGGGGAMSFFNRGMVTVEDCDFSHVDDDCFNLGTHFVRVVEKADPQGCRTEAWPGEFAVGDTVALWDWQNKTETAEAKITAAQKEKDGHWTLQFDRPLPFARVGEAAPVAGDFHQHLITQENDGIDRLVDFESGGSCILRRNIMSSLRARCFLVKTGHSLIEDNIFHDTHMPAVLAGPEFFWGEAPELRGLIIRHNVFRNIDAPNISVATFSSGKIPITGSANRDVTIENNTFENYGGLPVIYMGYYTRYDPQGVAIQVLNTDGVTIRGNKITLPAPGCPPGVDPIRLGDCRDVHVSP